MSVQKSIELIGDGDTIQDAVVEALDRAPLSVEGITAFDVVRVSGVVDGASTAFRVEIKVWFTLLERLHG